jgi:hypothetical protein
LAPITKLARTNAAAIAYPAAPIARVGGDMTSMIMVKTPPPIHRTPLMAAPMGMSTSR